MVQPQTTHKRKKMLNFKLTRKNMVIFIVLLCMMVTLASDMPVWAKILITVICAVAYYFVKKPDFDFSKGVSLVQQHKIDEAIICFEKAIRGDLKNEEKLAISSVYIQFGKEEDGLKIVEKLLASGQLNHNMKLRAASLKSLALWNLKKRDEAVVVLEEVVDNGYEDDNILSTLSVYLLSQDKFKDVKKYLTSSDWKEIPTGLLDSYLWLSIAEDDWKKAEVITKELMDRDIKFPEAYYHLALVSIHQNRISKVKDYLEYSLSSPFVPNAVITEDFIQKLYNKVANQNGLEKIAPKLEGHYRELAKGDAKVLDLLA